MNARIWFRRLWQSVLLAIMLWLAGSFIVAFVMTRRPRAHFAEPAPLVPWGSLEDIRLQTDDGEQLGAWYSRGPVDGPSVIILHGHRGCRRNSLRAAEFFAGRRASLLLPSLRAHGDSTGSYVDFGYSAKHDVVAAVDFVERERPGRPIVVAGVSMGAAAAIYGAPTLGGRVHGYLLESPYLDLRHAARHRAEMLLPPGADFFAYQGLNLVSPLVLPHVDRLSPLNHIGDMSAGTNVLFLSGVRDRHAPSAEVQILCDHCGAIARHIVIDDAGHGSILRDNPEQFESAVEQWLTAVAATKK